jgi:DNA invertase Pin-like site-specific DNA recombinase
MAKAFGYCREHFLRGETHTLASQTAAVTGFCNGRGLELACVLTDGRGSLRLPWLGRPAGRQLAKLVGSGDHVVVASGEAIATSPATLLGYVLDWQARGITLHILTVSGRSRHPEIPLLSTENGAGAMAAAALAVAASLTINSQSEAIRAGIAERRRQNRRHTCWPPYAYRWTGRAGNRRLTVDDAEWTTIRRIAEWRDAGLCWRSIASKLRGVLTRAGKEWSAARCRRAFLAAIRLTSGGLGNSQGNQSPVLWTPTALPLQFVRSQRLIPLDGASGAQKAFGCPAPFRALG